ncbi:PepSY domain-containing protein [Croceicoccus ponticola]|uniref:PepSY domain-containing protein n=1 Tax=Croceicoccus ponticola TaxID=2217664 RepID=A0A437GW51_9SPHN|nr:PepSY-associated TM helix domain-containing protein [Croceicoccus ponticola]RVQ66360.1 PepSY domain-containing protein [Croceicoccus ponticola]
MAVAERRGGLRLIARLHRWLGLAAAIIWMLQAATGVLLAFHFEADDALLSTERVPTDFDAIQQHMSGLDNAGGEAGTIWVWTTAGLPDRYVVLYRAPDGDERTAKIDGAGRVLRDAAADDYTFLGLMREIHLTLLSGNVGHWILGIAGLLLFTNILFGLYMAWPRSGHWRRALVPVNSAGPSARSYSWHRAVGLWGAIPAAVSILVGSLMVFEHQIGDAIGVEEITLPANPARGAPVGLDLAARAAVDAIPGSRFVGTTMPSVDDASYYAWVRGPGELYRGGYGGSLVIVDANDGSVRGAWPGTEAAPARALMGSLYPLHTGEAAGTLGRILVMLTGVWLIVMAIVGVQLWQRRRAARRAR